MVPAFAQNAIQVPFCYFLREYEAYAPSSRKLSSPMKLDLIGLNFSLWIETVDYVSIGVDYSSLFRNCLASPSRLNARNCDSSAPSVRKVGSVGRSVRNLYPKD